MFDKIKNWFFNKDLVNVINQKNGHKPPKTNTLDYKNVGILYQLDANQQNTSVDQFSAILKKTHHSAIHSLAYNDENMAKEGGQSYIYYKNQINWYGIPKSEEIDAFTSMNFDILFVLLLDPPPHLQYITALTQASFKVGPQFENAVKYLDLIIDNKDQSTVAKLVENLTKTINKIAIQK